MKPERALVRRLRTDEEREPFADLKTADPGNQCNDEQVGVANGGHWHCTLERGHTGVHVGHGYSPASQRYLPNGYWLRDN